MAVVRRLEHSLRRPLPDTHHTDISAPTWSPIRCGSRWWIMRGLS